MTDDRKQKRLKDLSERMFLLSKPNQNDIANFIDQSSQSDFSYPEVGITVSDGVDPKYTIDKNRILLGKGRRLFELAKSALKQWKMFDFSWVELHSNQTSIETGENVAIVIEHFGLYSMNNARIAYVIEESDRFGFAYGTLEGHAEIGEERFMVEIVPDTQEVFYSLYAVSRPGHILAKLGYPIVRRLQKQFAVDSLAAMQRHVTE